MELVKPIVELYRRMSCGLPADVAEALERALGREEKGSHAERVLRTLLENVRLARKTIRPLCQDTGLPVFYVTRPCCFIPSPFQGEGSGEGRSTRTAKNPTPHPSPLPPEEGEGIQGNGTPSVYYGRGLNPFPSECEIREAILAATREATTRGYLRANAVDPVTGENSGDNTGVDFPIIHFHEAEETEKTPRPVGVAQSVETAKTVAIKPPLAQGAGAASDPLSLQGGERDRVRGGVVVIDAMLKGGGCENAGMRYSLPDSSLGAGRDLDGVRRCVLDAVHHAQGRACPPYVLGAAIGGARDATASLAKRQLMRRLDDRSPVEALAGIEARLLEETNALGIGPAGLGGRTTVLGVKLAAQHRHVPCFFVEVSFGCWAMRRGRVTVDREGAHHE